MRLFQGVELPQEGFCVRTFGLPEIRGSCLSLGCLPIIGGRCPLSHWPLGFLSGGPRFELSPGPILLSYVRKVSGE